MADAEVCVHLNCHVILSSLYLGRPALTILQAHLPVSITPQPGQPYHIPRLKTLSSQGQLAVLEISFVLSSIVVLDMVVLGILDLGSIALLVLLPCPLLLYPTTLFALLNTTYLIQMNINNYVASLDIMFALLCLPDLPVALSQLLDIFHANGIHQSLAHSMSDKAFSLLSLIAMTLGPCNATLVRPSCFVFNLYWRLVAVCASEQYLNTLLVMVVN